MRGYDAYAFDSNSARSYTVGAIVRVHQLQPQKVKKGAIKPPKWNISVVGSACCIVDNHYLLTAHHLFNRGKPRDPNDRFYLFTVPQNDVQACRYPVVGFPLEDSSLDLGVVEVGAPTLQNAQLTALPVTMNAVVDGSHVMTMGFPAGEVVSANVDQQGNLLGVQMFLKSHANEGIVSAQYTLGATLFYELNVGWHHGESGGPIVRLEDPLAVFSIMQHYRNVHSPHGIVAGPHRGRSLSGIQNILQQLGAKVVP